MKIREWPLGEPTIFVERELDVVLIQEIADRNGNMTYDSVLSCLLQGSVVGGGLFCYQLTDGAERWNRILLHK